jgi:hypothetical protein
MFDGFQRFLHLALIELGLSRQTLFKCVKVGGGRASRREWVGMRGAWTRAMVFSPVI